MKREDVDNFEDAMQSNLDALENEYCCNDLDQARYEARRAEIKAFCYWARTKALDCVRDEDLQA